MRLSCAICGPTVPIKSDSLWNAHLVSKAHQEAVAKLRAVKEQMQKREMAEAERARLQQQQQQNQAAVGGGVKRKADGSSNNGGGGGLGSLVAYDDSESESDNEDGDQAQSSRTDSKRVKLQVDDKHEHTQSASAHAAMEESDDEDITAGLPAGFFDSSSKGPEAQEEAEEAKEAEASSEGEMEGVLPAGFFDDPEEDARIRSEVGGATADLQQRQLDVEFKALQEALANASESQDQQAQDQTQQGSSSQKDTSIVAVDQSAYDEQEEPEDEELEETVLARMEEEYQLFIEMQERLEALRMKKEKLSTSNTSSRPIPAALSPSSATIPESKPKSSKQKSILDVVREQERARKEKERQAAQKFARLKDASDSKMASDDEDDEDDSDDDEDIEAMMDWRARRV
ncbi:hypothetical protein BGZ94_010001 [Podila epigama]|nr:hypothetical protein BGZ94_010001 [Podila epigama]